MRLIDVTLSSGGGLNEIVGKGDQGQSPEKYVFIFVLNSRTLDGTQRTR